MEITLTTEIFIFLGQTLGGIITIVIMWQKMTARVAKLENEMSLNVASDKELRIKVEGLERLFTKIESLETKQNAHNEIMNATLSALTKELEKISNKMDAFVDGVNNVKLDVEGLKKNA